MTMTTERLVDVETPIELTRITGVRVHGDDGVSPVDRNTVRVSVTGSQRWLVWKHAGLERALNFRHLVEIVSDEYALGETRT